MAYNYCHDDGTELGTEATADGLAEREVCPHCGDTYHELPSDGFIWWLPEPFRDPTARAAVTIGHGRHTSAFIRYAAVLGWLALIGKLVAIYAPAYSGVTLVVLLAAGLVWLVGLGSLHQRHEPADPPGRPTIGDAIVVGTPLLAAVGFWINWRLTPAVAWYHTDVAPYLAYATAHPAETVIGATLTLIAGHAAAHIGLHIHEHSHRIAFQLVDVDAEIDYFGPTVVGRTYPTGGVTTPQPYETTLQFHERLLVGLAPSWVTATVYLASKTPLNVLDAIDAWWLKLPVFTAALLLFLTGLPSPGDLGCITGSRIRNAEKRRRRLRGRHAAAEGLEVPA